tara:strand:+ start:1545 stop:1688 length:144 start_codon:yes stop_codon:yes gene_type:complete
MLFYNSYYSKLFLMAILAGFEPATCPLGGGCSIQLSHRTFKNLINQM